MAKVAAVTVPVDVTFLNPVMSLFASTTATLLAATVPAVTPSNISSSASTRDADPMAKVAAVTVPVDVTFLNPVMSLFASTTTAFEAATVPAVMPVSKDNPVI